MFDFSNIGESALTSHVKGKKHCKHAPTIFGFQNSYFSKSRSRISKSLLDSVMVSTSVADAEICWPLNVLLSKYSESSCVHIRQLFKVMFPDMFYVK